MVLEFLYIGLAVYFFPRLSVDYEYIFCDGQVDFDKIMGNVKRKTVIKVDLDETEIVAPATSHVLDEYKNKNYKVKDFTSGLPECKPYVMISHYKEEYIKVYFEPSEKMVEAMRMKAPRKVFSY